MHSNWNRINVLCASQSFSLALLVEIVCSNKRPYLTRTLYHVNVQLVISIAFERLHTVGLVACCVQQRPLFRTVCWGVHKCDDVNSSHLLLLVYLQRQWSETLIRESYAVWNRTLWTFLSKCTLHEMPRQRLQESNEGLCLHNTSLPTEIPSRRHCSEKPKTSSPSQMSLIYLKTRERSPLLLHAHQILGTTRPDRPHLRHATCVLPLDGVENLWRSAWLSLTSQDCAHSPERNTLIPPQQCVSGPNQHLNPDKQAAQISRSAFSKGYQETKELMSRAPQA